MKAVVIFLFFTFLFPLILLSQKLVLTQEERLWIANHPVVKVSNELDWLPYDFAVDGQAQGYSVDIIKTLAKKIGIKVEFINGYSWNELIDQFDQNNIDLMHVMTKDEKRVQKYLFSEPYMPWKVSYLIREDEKRIDSPSDFDGKKIAVVMGWSTSELIEKLYPKAIIIAYENSLQMLEALSNSQVDIAIDNMYAAKYTMAEHLIANIKYGGTLEFAYEGKKYFYFVTQKDKPELISLFNKAYKLLSVDEKLKIQKKWFSGIKKFSVALNEKEKNYLHKKKIIKMCIDPNWMPFEEFDSNGNYRGMVADYFKIFQKLVGVPIVPLKTQNWEESIEAAKNRKCDIFSLAMATPERKMYMDFTTPYLSIPLALATRLDIPFIDHINLIKKEKIGIVQGYAFNEFIRRDYPNIEVVDVANVRDGLQKVANGELFGFIGTLASIGYVFQKDFMGELKISGKFNEKWELGIGVRNDEPLLVSIFEKVVASLEPNIKQKLLNKYIAINYERKTDYSLLIKVLIGVFILMSIGLYHNRKLSLVNSKMKQLQEELTDQAHKDPLTHLYNRRYFHEIATNVLKIKQRNKIEISIVMLDIDNFKNINDTYGHAVGDKVIKLLAQRLTENTRDGDIVSRFGGEEFILLLPNTNKAGATTIASILREVIKKESIVLEDGKSFSFTVSMGVSEVVQNDKDIELAIQKADKALYRAKESGKNRVVTCDE